MAFVGTCLVRPAIRFRRLPVSHLAGLHTSQCVAKEDRRTMLKSMPKRDEGVQGVDNLAIDITRPRDRAFSFPDLETFDRLFNGVPFKDVPVVHIKVSKNNTLIACTSPNGDKHILKNSCGTEGFKNCRKGTNVAAQTTGMVHAQKLSKLGVKQARICIQGLVPGRMSSIKGLTLGGLEIVSITDNTPFCDFPPRPPAARSL